MSEEIPVVPIAKTIGDVTQLTTPELLAAHDRIHIVFRSDGLHDKASLIDSHARVVDQLYERGLAHPPPATDGLDGLSVPFEIHSAEQPENHGCDPRLEKADTLSKKMIIEQRNKDKFPSLCQICKASPAAFDTWFEGRMETCAALCLSCVGSEEINKNSINVPILKLDDEKRIMLGIALEPKTIRHPDSQNDYIKADVIEVAAHNFLAKFGQVGGSELGIMHKQFGDIGLELVESYVALKDDVINRKPVKKGSWVIAVRALNDELWQRIKRGEFNGFSIGGVAAVE